VIILTIATDCTDFYAGSASIREDPSGPSAFGILVSVDDRLEFTTEKHICVAVKSNQTLASFKEDLLTHHGLLLTDFTLILIGRELKDDEKTLEELGFIPGCTVHAVAKVQFCVSTPTSGDFEMAVGPMTRISVIRKMLEEVDADTKYDEYWFTLNGMDNLKESRTFWDLDILSGTMILLKKRCYITLTIRYKNTGRTFDITADEHDTVEGLQQRIVLELGIPGDSSLRLTYRLKVLSTSRTLKQEQLESGETVDVMVRLNDTSFTSGAYLGGSMVDSAEANLEDSPVYSQ